MSKERYGSLTGLRQMRMWVIVVAVLVVAAIASAAAAAIRGARSPEPNQQADAGPSAQPTPSDSATPTGSPEPSPTPAATTTSAAASSAGQSPSAPKPRVTSFSATANGRDVTVTFTVAAQADRGPFTCSIRRASVGTEEVPCTIGPNSRTYNYRYCTGGEIYVIAIDRFGVRSDQWNDVIDAPCPDPPTYTNLRGWHDGSLVHIAFDVIAAPGDNPRCEIDIFTLSIDRRWEDVPCPDSAEVSFPGPKGNYTATITIRSDSFWSPGPPKLEPIKVP